MASALASLAAAVAAGYTSTITDRGASAPAAERYYCRLEKRLTGGANLGAVRFRADGFGSSQVNAEAAATNALNEQRALRYGRGATNSTNSRGSGALTSDAD